MLLIIISLFPVNLVVSDSIICIYWLSSIITDSTNFKKFIFNTFIDIFGDIYKLLKLNIINIYYVNDQTTINKCLHS